MSESEGGGAVDIGVFGARGIPSTYSGYETFLTELLPELAGLGHRVTMYCRRGEVEPLPWYRGVRCVHLPALRSKQFSTPSHGLIAGFASRVARHDVVFAVNVSNAAFCLLSRMSGRRTVLNTDGQEWLRGKWGPAGRTIFLASAHLVGRSVNAAISDGNAMRSIYLRQFDSDSTVIPYCWSGIEPAPHPALLRDLGLPPRGYLLVAGRLVPENQIAPIARAYLNSLVSLPIVVLGTANYRSPVAEELSAMARDDRRLILPGHVEDRNEFCGLVRDAAAYIHGHQVGGTNPSLIEAMGSGARIIAASNPFNRETLGDAGDYFQRPDEDLVPLIHAVVDEEPSVGVSRRRAARSRALQLFSLPDVAAAHAELFAAVAARPLWSGTRLKTRWERGFLETEPEHARE